MQAWSPQSRPHVLPLPLAQRSSRKARSTRSLPDRRGQCRGLDGSWQFPRRVGQTALCRPRPRPCSSREVQKTGMSSNFWIVGMHISTNWKGSDEGYGGMTLQPLQLSLRGRPFQRNRRESPEEDGDEEDRGGGCDMVPSTSESQGVGHCIDSRHGDTRLASVITGCTSKHGGQASGSGVGSRGVGCHQPATSLTVPVEPSLMRSSHFG